MNDNSSWVLGDHKLKWLLQESYLTVSVAMQSANQVLFNKAIAL